MFIFIKLLPYKLLLSLLLMIAVMVSSMAQAQIQIQDSHGKYSFAKPPERVVVLNWALAEQMLELGEAPVGFADIDGYKSHTSNAVIPNGVVDVGERLSPKLSLIRELKPDVILIGYSQRSLLRPLSNIATVIYFKNFGKRYNNHEKSQSRFLEMAKLFDKTEMANRKLLKRDQRLLELKDQLQKSYADKILPTVEFIVPDALDASKLSSVLMFGENSMPFYAAQELGLTVLSAPENDQFGAARLNQKEYLTLFSEQAGNVCKLYLSSYAVDKQVAVETNRKDVCAKELSYQNAFGGVMSILYMAESISQALTLEALD